MSYAAPIPDESVVAHDLARAVPEAMWAAVIDGLVGHVGEAGRCVDIGIGTGAVGGRLARRGLDVVGLDCNSTMLRGLRAGHPFVPAVLGDAERLPFPSAVADLAVMACVLHLVADWHEALHEAMRVVRRGGVLAVNVGQSALAGRTGVSRTFLDAVTSRVALGAMGGPSSSAELAAALEQEGCVRLDPIEVRGSAPRSVRDHIYRLEWNPFGWPPGTPQWALSEAAQETTRWATETFGDIDEAVETPVALGFAVFGCP